MLFTLPEAKPTISNVMRKWFAKQARLAAVFNLLFLGCATTRMYLDIKFLAYAQGAETYNY